MRTSETLETLDRGPLWPFVILISLYAEEAFLYAYIDESGNTGFNLFDAEQLNIS